MSWRTFWDGDHSIYVNARHRALHNADIAKDIGALIVLPESLVLDYGCGEASMADSVAIKCKQLYLFDQAASVQAKLRAKFGHNSAITVLTSEGLESVPRASLDLIIVHSLLQYLSYKECEALLARLHDKLAPAGRLVIGDLIKPSNNPLEDARQLLNFAWRGGFLFAALRGLVATTFSPYRALRQKIGLTSYALDDIQTLLAANGFSSAMREQNLGMNQSRFCVEARRRDEGR